MLRLAVALVLCAAAASASIPPHGFDASDLERLDRGEVVIHVLESERETGIALRAAALVDARPDEVWPALRDCGRYQEFLPGVTASTLESRERDVAICYSEYAPPWPLPPMISKTRVREGRIEGGGWARRWEQIEGSYARDVGSWKLYAWRGGRTLAVYEADVDPDMPLPEWLVRQAQAATMPKIFAALRGRVHELRAHGITPP